MYKQLLSKAAEFNKLVDEVGTIKETVGDEEVSISYTRHNECISLSVEDNDKGMMFIANPNQLDLTLEQAEVMYKLLGQALGEEKEEHTEWVPKVGDVVRVLTRNEMLDNSDVVGDSQGNLRAGGGASFTDDMDKFSGNNYRIDELRDNDSVIQLEGVYWSFHTWMLELVEGAK